MSISRATSVRYMQIRNREKEVGLDCAHNGARFKERSG